MRDITEVFANLGSELSKVQLNELFMLMDAGRNFSRGKFQKWVYKNSNFIGNKEDQKLLPANQKSGRVQSRNDANGLVGITKNLSKSNTIDQSGYFGK
jgi:hypothetical protein